MHTAPPTAPHRNNRQRPHLSKAKQYLDEAGHLSTVETGFLYEHRDYAVPEYLAPSLSSKVVSGAPNVVIAPAGPPANGWFHVLRPDRSYAWVESKYLRPWSNPYAPKARCVPSIISDGSIGTGTGS